MTGFTLHRQLAIATSVVTVVAVGGLVGMRALGQTAGGPPFMFSGATIAEPQINVAVSGVTENVSRATVSADRKYVTLDLHPRVDRLLGFRTFSFQNGAGGFVGSAAAQGMANAPTVTPNSPTPSISTSVRQIQAVNASILDRPGMTLIAPLR